MANETRNDKPAERKPATPDDISKATVAVAALLAPLAPVEQWRVIHAASAINGIQPPRSQQQQQGKR